MTHDKYDTDILKTLKSIDASLKSIAKSVQPVNTTVVIDNNSEEAVKEFLNSLHRKNVQQEDAECQQKFLVFVQHYLLYLYGYRHSPLDQLYGGILFTTYSLNLVEMNVAVKDGNTWQNCESYDRKRFKC